MRSRLLEHKLAVDIERFNTELFDATYASNPKVDLDVVFTLRMPT